MVEQSQDPLLTSLFNVVAGVDPVPPSVTEAARAAYVWRTIDADLAELTADSAIAAAGVRSSSAPRLVTFEGAGVEVEVEVAQTGSTRRLAGQVVPVGPARVTVRWSGGTQETLADDLGRFSAVGVPAGSVSLVVERAGAEHPVVTSWISI